ncbi:TetR/AcrR family transcriptional regulator [Yoonia sp. MH D7]
MTENKTSLTSPKIRTGPRVNDASASKSSILQSALIEFASKGYDGARVNEIASRAGISKPLMYEYFGDKEAVYSAALREAYVQIRRGEEELDMEGLDPKDAIRTLVVFTMNHFRRNPWFISMLNTENLRGGTTIKKMEGASDIQSPLVRELKSVLDKGEKTGQFRPGLDAAEIYIFIASLCYFPVSNSHTLLGAFGCKIDADWLDRRAEEASEMMVRYLSINP